MYNAQIADAISRVATLTEQQYRLEGLISLESMRVGALCAPQKLIAMILAGDPAMRLNIRAEICRLVLRIDLDFKAKPEKILIKVTFINDAARTTEFRQPIKFTKPLHPRRSRRHRPITPVVGVR